MEDRCCHLSEGAKRTISNRLQVTNSFDSAMQLIDRGIILLRSHRNIIKSDSILCALEIKTIVLLLNVCLCQGFKAKNTSLRSFERSELEANKYNIYIVRV